MQNTRNLEMAISHVTGLHPVWLESCYEECNSSCNVHCNVAEIQAEDTLIGKMLGSGEFGAVYKGSVKFGNGIRLVL